MKTLTKTTLAVVLAGGVLAGCGGGSQKGAQPSTAAATTTASTAAAAPAKPTLVLAKPAYERTMRGLGHRLALSIQTIYPLDEGQPGSAASKESLARLERARATVVTVASRISAISPPSPIRAEHRRLIASLTALESDLDKLISAVQQGSLKDLGRLSQFPSLNAIRRVSDAMAKKGFAIG